MPHPVRARRALWLCVVACVLLLAPPAAAAPKLGASIKQSGRSVEASGAITGKAAWRLGAPSSWRAVLEERAGGQWVVRVQSRLKGAKRTFALCWPVPGSGATAVTVRVRVLSGKKVVAAGRSRVFRLPGASPVADDGSPPPDPATVAPPLPLGESASVAAMTSFLYTGTRPIQRDVSPGAIKRVSGAVVRGRVLDIAGAPLPGVKVDVPITLSSGSPAVARTDASISPSMAVGR